MLGDDDAYRRSNHPQTAVTSDRKLLYAPDVAYLPRVVDARIDQLLAKTGAVMLEGPRACGKTSTGLQHARSSVRLDTSPAAVELAELDPAGVLAGEMPRLVDEWQNAPSLGNLIRQQIDAGQRPGQFILTRSATPPSYLRRHYGASPSARARMRPMSLAENQRSTGQVSLAALADGGRLSGIRSPLPYRDLAAEAVRGGWPALVEASIADAMEFNASYLADLATTDLPQAGWAHHDPVRLHRLLTSLAHNIATEAPLARLVADVAADGGHIDRNTVRAYLDALTRVFAYEEQPAWAVSLRSRARLRSRPKLHLADPALACAALHLTPDRLASDPVYFAQVFEAMVIRDLRTYLDPTGGHILHYRDETGLTIDAILEFADGGWAAIEIELGEHRLGDAETALLKLRDERVDLDQVGPPRFLAVITGGTNGYTLRTGIHAVPLATLTA